MSSMSEYFCASAVCDWLISVMASVAVAWRPTIPRQGFALEVPMAVANIQTVVRDTAGTKASSGPAVLAPRPVEFADVSFWLKTLRVLRANTDFKPIAGSKSLLIFAFPRKPMRVRMSCRWCRHWHRYRSHRPTPVSLRSPARRPSSENLAVAFPRCCCLEFCNALFQIGAAITPEVGCAGCGATGRQCNH